MLKLYNTLGRKKEIFKPLKDKTVGMYSCGPTVYDYMHLGNLRAFIAVDILKRWLIYNKYKIKHIMNITDVDDKLIKKSQGGRIKLKEITKKYEKAFLEDINRLNILPADSYPKATENIREMIQIIEELIKKGYAYKTNDGIYFSIKKFKEYGKLSKTNIKGLKAGARIANDEYDKSSANDFALWKFYNQDDGEIFWDSGIGKGRPGWHIECSAMSSKYLGKQFDVHTGGIDLVFPHHENEIAQSEAAFGKKPWVKYWFHNEHLVVDGKKMSKSLGNFYVLEDIIKKGFSLNAIRYMLLATHYRQKLNLTEKELKASEESVKRIIGFVKNSKDKKDGKEIAKLVKESEKGFEQAINDDLNIAKALGILFTFIRNANKFGAGKKAHEFIKKINAILGLSLEEKIKIPEVVKKLAIEREKARKAKDWKKSDELREKIKNVGYYVDDTSKGGVIKKL